ncbi:MAG: radical SAM protein [bacterium]
MHIQFVNAVLGGDFSALDIGITQIATYINERTKHKASILDLVFHRKHWKKHLKSGIEKHKPDIIGISTNTMYMQYVKTIIKEIKEKYRIPVILGGHHASVYPEETLSIPEVDAVCIGDGEFALEEYLSRVEDGKSLEGIKGIWVKENKKLIRNPGGQFIENIDRFPYPDWNLWEDLEKYFYFLGMLYIQGSRGCPYRCTYCDACGIKDAVGGEYFRLRNPIQFAGEIKYQWDKYRNLDHPPRIAQLFDPVFTINEEWIENFCGEYRNLGLHKEFRFSVFSRIDNLNEKKIKILGKSGCAIIRAGVECGNERIRNEIYRKNISNDKVREMFHLCRKAGIGFTAFYIIGGPGEDKRTIGETIEFARELDAERSAFFIYKPFTKEGVKQIKECGGSVSPLRWKEADNITFGAVVRLKDVSPQKAENFQKIAYLLTFGKRFLRMLNQQKFKYFIRLFTYLFRGFYYGLDIKYLLTYYHIYSYDNVDK